jgi:uncharacterized protein
VKPSRYNIVVPAGPGRVGLYNGVTGGVLVLDEDRWQAAQGGGVTATGQVSPETVANLIVGGMLVPGHVDELEHLRRRFDDARSSSRSLGVTVAASLGCNFACPYCFEEKHPRNLTRATSDALVAYVEGRAQAGLEQLHVTWFGGEPLMALAELLNLSRRLIRLAEERGFSYSADIVTNGYLLSKSVCEDLVAARVSAAQIGIDGPPEVHNLLRPLKSGRETFDRVMSNIVTAVDYLNVSVRVNVSRRNQDSFSRVCDLLETRGLGGRLTVYPGRVTHVTTNPAAPSAFFSVDDVLSASEFAGFERKAEEAARAVHQVSGPSGLPSPVDTPCTAVRDHDLVVGPDGTVWRCWNSVGDYAASTGSLFAETTQRQERSGAYWREFTPFDDAQCRSCIALPVCMGGCAHEGLNSSERSDQCSTFRINNRERVAAFVGHHTRSDGHSSEP